MNDLRRPGRNLSDDLLRQAEEWGGIELAEPEQAEEWTLDRIRQAALMAASRCRYPASSLADDPVRLAESGVGLAVAIDPTISFRDAIHAGQDEIFNAARDMRHSRGLSAASAHEPAPRFWTYWESLPETFPPPDYRDARRTLAAVMQALPEKWREILVLQAFTATTAEAAEAYGYASQSSYLGLVRKARSAALELWFDQESPPDLRRLPIYRRKQGRACPQGHEISGSNVRREKSASGRIHERCRECRTAQDRAHRDRRAA